MVSFTNGLTRTSSWRQPCVVCLSLVLVCVHSNLIKIQAMSLHLSFGQGGDARTVLFCVESNPSMLTRAAQSSIEEKEAKAAPSPIQLYDQRLPKEVQSGYSDLSPHDQRRARSCAACLRPISRSSFAKANKNITVSLTTRDSSALKWLLYHLPAFDNTVSTIGTSLCYACANVLRRKRPLPKKFSLAATASLLANITPTQRVEARSCKNDGPLCSFCSKFEATAQPGVLPRGKESPSVPPFKRRHAKSPPPVTTRSPARLSSDDHMVMKATAALSGRQAGRIASSLKRRFAEGHTSVDSVGGSLVRRDSTKQNKVFEHLFTSVDCEYSTVDGAAYVCLDLTLLVVLIAYLRDQAVSDLRLIKFIVDAGQGSLKLLLQLLWYNDEVFSSNTYKQRRAGDALRDHGGLSDNGAQRTFIVGKIMTSSESFASVRFLVDRYNYVNLRHILHESCEIIGPNDLKMGAILAGIGSSGSRHPQPCTLFSMYKGHS